MTDKKEEPSLNSEGQYWENLDINDCGYLLRTLEREAFSSVVNALRAKGPPSEYTSILLNHLQSALSINDELGRAEIRKAAVDEKLCKLSNILNPSYDTCTEWLACTKESRGLVEAGPARGKPFANTSSSSIADQLLCHATTKNEEINRSAGKSFQLLSLPYKPFVPERLRLLLRETDRPDQRISHALETIHRPTVTTCVDRSGRDGRQLIKKKRQRTSKGIKEKKLPELGMQKNPIKEEEESVKSSLPDTTSTSILTPVTPLAVNAAAPVVAESAGNSIISPGQPPQSGDAMKTWVSKIHEQEMAASAAQNGSIPPPEEINTPNTTILTPTTPVDDAGKKKRRPRAPVQDPEIVNSCARTRPFRFEPKNGRLKPPRGNPERSDSRASTMNSSPGFEATPTSIHPVGIAAAKLSNIDHRVESNRNGTMEVASTGISSTSSISGAVSPAGYRSGSASSGSRPTSSYLTSSQLKRPHVSTNSSRAGPKYFVNNSGVPVATIPSALNTGRSSSTTGGIGARTTSLGNGCSSAYCTNRSTPSMTLLHQPLKEVHFPPLHPNPPLTNHLQLHPVDD